jgi:hypothetical protein
MLRYLQLKSRNLEKMSRLPRDYVWFQWNLSRFEVECPVCYKNRMMRYDENSWHREHIIPVRSGGSDIYCNVIPICKDCNLRMGKSCTSTFDYMAQIGTMTREESTRLEKEHRDRCEYLVNPNKNGNSKPLECARVNRNGNKCNNLKWGKNEEYCAQHDMEGTEKMDWQLLPLK